MTEKQLYLTNLDSKTTCCYVIHQVTQFVNKLLPYVQVMASKSLVHPFKTNKLDITENYMCITIILLRPISSIIIIITL